MSTFSNYLQNYLFTHNTSIKEMSKLCQLPLITAKSIVNGKILPENLETVQTIYTTLHMSANEKQELTELFIKENKGSNILYYYQLMEKLIDKVSTTNTKTALALPPLSYKTVPESSNNYIMLKSKKETHEAIKYALEYSLSKGHTNIYAYMQPEKFINTMILRYFNNNNITLHQIFCCNPSTNQYNIENLEALLLTLDLLLNDVPIKFSYFNNNIKHHLNNMSIMPHMIIIGNMTIFLNPKSDTGYFINDENYALFTKNIFKQKQQLSQPFLNKIPINHFIKCLQNNPYEVYGLAFPIINYFTNESTLKFKSNIILDKSDLINFLKTDGIINFNIPNAKFLSADKRYSILNNLLNNMKNGISNVYFSKEGYSISNNTSILTTQSNIYIIKNNEDEIKIWHFSDSGICNIFKQYFSYRVDTKRTLSHEESINCLQTILRKHNEGR